MSRSSSGAALLGLCLVAALAGPTPAVAEDTAPVVAVEAPTQAIVAPVLDISFGQADLQQRARVEQTPARTTVTLDSTVLFGRDSATINARADGRLAEVARDLAARGPGAVTITGYTDDLGSAASGLTLSRRRAEAVAKVLRRDLPAAQFPFTVVGRGEADPAVPNTSERNRKINRRVVIVYARG